MPRACARMGMIGVSTSLFTVAKGNAAKGNAVVVMTNTGAEPQLAVIARKKTAKSAEEILALPGCTRSSRSPDTHLTNAVSRRRGGRGSRPWRSVPNARE